MSWTGSASASGTGGFVARASDVLSHVVGLSVCSLGDLQQHFLGAELRDVVHLQFWHRDPGDPFGSGLGDALRLGLAQ